MIRKVILFADSKVGFEILSYVYRNFSNDLCKVITNNDQKIEGFCITHKINFERFESEKEISKFILEENIDLGILAWWPKIISQELLQATQLGFINLHNSLLPYNKGKHPYFWTFIEDTPYGVTIHKVDEGIDTGPIINQKTIKYGWEDNAGTLYEKSLLEIVNLFSITYPNIKKFGLRSLPQEHKGTFHYGDELEGKSEILLDKQYTARELLNILRGRTSSSRFPSSYFRDGKHKYRVKVFIEKEN